jgi:site-specific recombinase XerD
MSTQKHKSDYPGVRYREHETRKHGVMKDRYFFIRYRVNGKLVEEGVGWASKGMTAKKANATLAELHNNHRLGEGPQTLRAKQELEQARLVAEQEEKAQIEKDSLTFAAFWKDIYFPQAKHDKKATSVEREMNLFRIWIDPVIGHLPLKAVSPFDIEKIKKTMADAGQSSRSIQYALAVTRQVFNHARRLGYFQGDPPTAKVKWPKVDNAKLRYITQEEAFTLLEALNAKSMMVHDVSLISLHCGLRFDEIASMEWQDVNLNEGFLLARDPKSNPSRMAFMTAEVRKMFSQKERGKPDEKVFSMKADKKKRISRTFDRVVSDLKLNDGITDRRLRFTFHTLRHSFASILAQQGVSLLTIKEALGHKSLAMAMRYSHLAPNALKETARVMERALKQKRPNKVIGINK